MRTSFGRQNQNSKTNIEFFGRLYASTEQQQTVFLYGVKYHTFKHLFILGTNQNKQIREYMCKE